MTTHGSDTHFATMQRLQSLDHKQFGDVLAAALYGPGEPRDIDEVRTTIAVAIAKKVPVVVYGPITSAAIEAIVHTNHSGLRRALVQHQWDRLRPDQRDFLVRIGNGNVKEEIAAQHSGELTLDQLRVFLSGEPGLAFITVRSAFRETGEENTQHLNRLMSASDEELGAERISIPVRQEKPTPEVFADMLAALSDRELKELADRVFLFPNSQYSDGQLVGCVIGALQLRNIDIPMDRPIRNATVLEELAMVSLVGSERVRFVHLRFDDLSDDLRDKLADTGTPDVKELLARNFARYLSDDALKSLLAAEDRDTAFAAYQTGLTFDAQVEFEESGGEQEALRGDYSRIIALPPEQFSALRAQPATRHENFDRALDVLGI